MDPAATEWPSLQAPDILERHMTTTPWHGILVATALPLHDDLSVDYDRYAEHVSCCPQRLARRIPDPDP